ncbi:hypothetical protein GYMLUDRAFT_44529 [Collybiopsis luxurians FD-317 M1]|uniref:F-box domain-containing protein n=1 Tax=Collybiopsis luxurians FD-317 M1 TaxID=944289 RepID=A0A0D0CUQ8_9AGAR|nr:hypothetical protein GYMLUDRAFT_44529 [Collybiopsis luxurians FD-317 M1]
MPLELRLKLLTGPLSSSLRRLTKHIVRKTYQCSFPFPNEIYALIFEHLTDNLSTLKNVSLVCRGFAVMAKPLIFRDIRLPFIWQSHDTFYPLVKRFWRLILAHPGIADSVRMLEISAYEMSSKELEQLDLILAQLHRLKEIWMDGPKIHHLQTIGRSFSDTLRELHCSDVYLDSPADFEVFQAMLNSLVVLKVLVLDATISRDAERPLILPHSLKIASFERVDITMLHCIGLGLAMSSNPPILRAILLELTLNGNWQNWLKENPDSHIHWNTLSISDTLVVLQVGASVEGITGPQSQALITPIKDMRVSQVMFAFNSRITLASFLNHFIPKLSATVHDIYIDINANCMTLGDESVLMLMETQFTYAWSKLDSLLVHRYEQGLLTRIRFRCTSRTGSFGYGGSFGKLVVNTPVRFYPTDRRILLQIEVLLPRAKSLGFLEVDHVTKYFEHSL